MRNVMVAGVGGQGTVLAAKVLATAAAQQGRAVRSVEALRSSRSLTIELADGICSIDRDDTSLSPANRQHNLP